MNKKAWALTLAASMAATQALAVDYKVADARCKDMTRSVGMQQGQTTAAVIGGLAGIGAGIAGAAIGGYRYNPAYAASAAAQAAIRAKGNDAAAEARQREMYNSCMEREVGR